MLPGSLSFVKLVRRGPHVCVCVCVCAYLCGEGGWVGSNSPIRGRLKILELRPSCLSFFIALHTDYINPYYFFLVLLGPRVSC